MDLADQFFDAVNAQVEKENNEMFSQLMTGLPVRFKGANKGRVRVLALHLHSRGYSVREAIEIACRRVDGHPNQTSLQDLDSKFWEKPSNIVRMVLS